MDSGLMVIDTVDSDKLKPYMRGESEGDSMNDPSLLHDSNGSADQAGPSKLSALAGDASSWVGNSAARGPQSDLLGVLEELEREAEAEAGKELVPKAQMTGLHQLNAGVLDSHAMQPVHSESQTKTGKKAPRMGSDLLQSLSAELPLPPPHQASTSSRDQTSPEENSRTREPTGQKTVLANLTIPGDCTTMPFKPSEPFNLERVAHQHILDLALRDLSPPASGDGRTHPSGRRPSANNNATPGPVTIMRNAQVKDKVGVGQTAGAALKDLEASSDISGRMGWGGDTIGSQCADSSIPTLKAPTLLSVAAIDRQAPSPHQSSLPRVSASPAAEQSCDALQKTTFSTNSPMASGSLATLNVHGSSVPSPRPSPSPRPAATKGLHAAESSSLLPSPPGRACPADLQLSTWNSPSFGPGEGPAAQGSRIPRSPADGAGHQSVDLTGMLLSPATSKLPALRRSDGSASLSQRGSNIPLSPVGSASDSTRKSKSLTPRGNRGVGKQGQTMEAATAELDKLAVMLKQMQEDIKAIPTEPGREASHALPSSTAPPQLPKASSHRRPQPDAPAARATPRCSSSTKAPPGVDIPDNEPLDKVEKMQETSTTVTVAGSRGVRKALHDAVAEEAVAGFGQSPLEASTEPSESLSKASLTQAGALGGGLSKASLKRRETSESFSGSSAKWNRSDQERVHATKHNAMNKYRSKRKATEAEIPQHEASAGRAAKTGPGPQQAAAHQAPGTGGNELEGKPPNKGEPEKNISAEELSSACLQPTDDDLVRVAVGKNAGGKAVVVHASLHRAHNDLEKPAAAAGGHEGPDVHTESRQHVQSKSSVPSDKAPLEGKADGKHMDAPDTPNPKCACCFM